MPRKPVRSVIRFLVHKYISDRNHQAIFHNSLIAREGKAGHPSLYVWWRRSRRRGPRAGPGPQGRRPGQPWSRPQLPRVIAPAEFPVFRFGLPSPRGIVPNCTSRRLWPWVAGFLDPRTPDRAQVCAPADGEKVRPPTTLAQPLSPDSASSAPPTPPPGPQRGPAPTRPPHAPSPGAPPARPHGSPGLGTPPARPAHRPSAGSGLPGDLTQRPPRPPKRAPIAGGDSGPPSDRTGRAGPRAAAAPSRHSPRGPGAAGRARRAGRTGAGRRPSGPLLAAAGRGRCGFSQAACPGACSLLSRAWTQDTPSCPS